MYQAQNSKMERPDLYLKDYILAGMDFEMQAGYQGVLDREQHIPTADFPSDHALIVATVAVRTKTQKFITRANTDTKFESGESTGEMKLKLEA
jgi:hypothetical protein